MPSFDFRGVKVAKYVNTNGTITYTDAQTCGQAMNANLELRYAEGRLYAESALAEYMKKAVGGTISLGVKYLPDDAQTLMFGATAKTRTVSSKSISGLELKSADKPSYVGIAFYAPDMIDGVEKYTCVFIKKALFGAPAMSYQTLGETITFNTPTTTGEFMADNSTNQSILETATADSQADAEAWITAVLA